MAFAVIGHSFVRRLQDYPLHKIEGADLHVGIGGANSRQTFQISRISTRHYV